MGKTAEAQEIREEEIVKSNDVAAATMHGDLVKCIVDELKLVDKPWQQLSEEHQGEILDRLTKRTRTMIDDCVSIISAGDAVSVDAIVDTVTFKKGAKIVLKATDADGPSILDLASHTDGQVKVVIVDASMFGRDESTMPEADPDQKDLGIGEEYENDGSGQEESGD